MKVEIEEGIYDISTKKSIRKSIHEYKNSKMTRQLYILGDSDYRNSKIDVIDFFRIKIEKIEKMSELQIGKMLKRQILECFNQNINNELKWFKFPIVTKYE